MSASTDIRLKSPVERGTPIEAALQRAVWLIPAASLAVVVAIFIPRFGVKSPSLVDDWFSLTYAPTAAHGLLRGHYDAAIVDYGGRYRPTYALLNEAQWMLGSRNSTLAPTLIGLLRLLFFVGAVGGLAVAVLRGLSSRTWLVIAASVVPVLVVATRGEAYNFVRFGVSEPTAFGFLAIGITGMAVAIRRLTQRSPSNASRRTLAIFAGGYLAYLFGAYMSEASAAVVVLLPALYFWITREPGHVRSRTSIVALSVAAILAVLPVVHVLFEVALAARGGTDGGSRSITALIGEVVRPAASTIEGVLTTASVVWVVLIPLTLVASARRALRKDRYGVLFTGMILSGFTAAYLANVGTSGTALSRYYVALLVPVAIAFVWLLESQTALKRAIILSIVLAVSAAGRGDQQAKKWLEMDHAGDTAIAFASGAYATKCNAYLVDFPQERRMGLARVLIRDSRTSLPGCKETDRIAYAISWGIGPLASSAYPPGCQTGWRLVAHSNSVQLARCSGFAQRGVIRNQDTLAGVRVVRLVPPTHWINASTLNRLPYVDDGPETPGLAAPAVNSPHST